VVIEVGSLTLTLKNVYIGSIQFGRQDGPVTFSLNFQSINVDYGKKDPPGKLD
jgi:type VI protein secretion system component Hcp